MQIRSLILGTLTFAFQLLNAQPSKMMFVEDADEHFRYKNYLSAIPIYKAELKKDPDNIDLKYRLGVCYVNSRLNRQQAITMLEEVSRHPEADQEIWRELGRAYHLSGRIEDAIVAYDKYAKIKPRHAEEVEHYIDQCDNALELMKHPVHVSFQNLGKEINSSEPDYYPYVDKDEMTLLYTTRRKENFGGKKVEVDGYRSSDIYTSNMVNGHWTAGKNLGRNVNGNLDEQVVGLRPDGLEMYVYFDHIETYGNLYVSKRADINAEFSKPKVCDPAINAEIESSGCMNEDGTIMIFARRNKIKDNSDLFISRKLPNGKWGIATPLPDVINSSYNEDMPYLSYDGKTLYFSSEGHNSMGGYDLFKSSWNQETNTFSTPVNLGYPLNSTDDERSICMTRDNKMAYVSAYRPSGYGDLDLYRVKFTDEEPVSVIYTGKVKLGDSAQAANISQYDIKIMVTDTQSNQEYLFIPQTRNGHYVMALPAGTYKLVTYCKGYVRHKEELIVSDMGKTNLERHKDLHLRRLKKNSG